MKKQGFSIIIIAIIAGAILVVSTGGYFGYKEIKSYQSQKAEKERQAQELIKAQQETLEKTKQEIEQLKTGQEKQEQESDAKISNLQQQLNTEKNKSQISTISAAELEPYLTAVANIVCKGGEGSGFLWKNGKEYLIVTNQHVVDNPYFNTIKNDFFCLASTDNLMQVYPYLSHTMLNASADIAVARLELVDSVASSPIESLNYKLSLLRRCLNNNPVGSPVAIVGFPAFGEQYLDVGEVSGTKSNRIVTEGIISGHDTAVSTELFGNMPYSNYFVSAKIDSGNSGGVALSKDTSGLCLLGVPTWISLGNYETQGIVQNINNVFYK